MDAANTAKRRSLTADNQCTLNTSFLPLVITLTIYVYRVQDAI